MNPEVITFRYEGQKVRVFFSDDSRPCWSVADVCKIMGIEDIESSFESIPEDERAKISLPKSRGCLLEPVVYKPGLHKLIAKGSEEVSTPFKQRIETKVIGSIKRKRMRRTCPSDAVSMMQRDIDRINSMMPKIPEIDRIDEVERMRRYAGLDRLDEIIAMSKPVGMEDVLLRTGKLAMAEDPFCWNPSWNVRDLPEPAIRRLTGQKLGR
ncbi:MAG: hypothetical protein WCA04_12300, partial [Geobacteraceae bacterium]